MDRRAAGNTGDIVLVAGGDISLFNSSQIRSNLEGAGTSGDIIIRAGGDLLVDSSQISNRVTSRGTGDAGDIDIQARRLRMVTAPRYVSNSQALITSETQGRGNGGHPLMPGRANCGITIVIVI